LAYFQGTYASTQTWLSTWNTLFCFLCLAKEVDTPAFKFGLSAPCGGFPATPEAKIRRIMVHGQAREGWEVKRVSETPISTNKLVAVVCTCYPSYSGGINRRITV
jgi:hypothetical protein